MGVVTSAVSAALNPVISGIARECWGQAQPVVAAKLRETLALQGFARVPESVVEATAEDVSRAKNAQEAEWLLAQRVRSFAPGASVGTAPVESQPRPVALAQHGPDSSDDSVGRAAMLTALRDLEDWRVRPDERAAFRKWQHMQEDKERDTELADLRWQVHTAPMLETVKHIAYGAGGTIVFATILYGATQFVRWLSGGDRE